MNSLKQTEAIRALSFRILSYGFPLLTIPAFAGALTSEDYGRLGLSLTFCTLLQAVAEGGHNIGGARQLIDAEDDRRAHVFAAIYDQKTVLLLCCLFAALLYHFAVGSSERDVALFAICFFAVVVPDSLTPVWDYQASGRLSELTRIQFFSRAVALPLMLLGIWIWPNPLVAALMTGLPFLICAWVAVRSTGSYLHLLGWRLPSIASLRGLRHDHLLLYAGTIASTLTPMLAMQTIGHVYGIADLGSIYLAVVLWLACRQLCGLANQSAFRKFAIIGEEKTVLSLTELFASARWGAGIALAATAVTSMAYIAFASQDGIKYAETLRALPWMLSGLIVYSFGHALAMNLFAARGRSGVYAAVHISSALALSVSIFVLAPFFERPIVLGLACLAADLLLLTLTMAVQQSKRLQQ